LNGSSSRLDLLDKSPLVLGVAIAFLEYELADLGAGIQRQGSMPEIDYFQDLMVRDAGMHETCGNMNSKSKTRKSAPAFKPARDIIGERDLFFRDPQDHLARLYHDIAAILNMNAFGYIFEPGVILDVIDLELFFKDPEIIAERKIDRTGSDL
jgi:hypothetical protein